MPSFSWTSRCHRSGLCGLSRRLRSPPTGTQTSSTPPTTKYRRTRDEAAMQLLNAGSLHTGEDFTLAAFLFQHGETPDDYLLAHTLAMVALGKGYGGALWIATATLDRYLQSMHQPQIYGTQFLTSPSKPATQEPFHRNLISDELRRQLGVPSLAAQEEQRKYHDQEQKTVKEVRAQQSMQSPQPALSAAPN